MDKKKILIVEDEKVLRDLYVEILIDAGFDTESAMHGEEGLTKLQIGGYDLVLLDIMLPKKDGIQILKELKLHPSQKPNKRIVMLSSLNQDFAISQTLDLGVRGYMLKSDFTPDQLVHEVQNFLSN